MVDRFKIKQIFFILIIVIICIFVWKKTTLFLNSARVIEGDLGTLQNKVVTEQIISACEIKPRIFEEYRVNSKGKLLDIPVRVGQKVNVGDLLAVIDGPDVKDEYRRAQDNYAMAQAEYAKLVSLYEHNKLLYEKDIISQDKLLKTKEDYQNFQIDKLKISRQDLEKAALSVKNLDVYSKISGYIVEQFKYKNDIVLNGDSLFVIAQDQELYARFYISPIFREKIKLGLPVYFYQTFTPGDKPIAEGQILLVSDFVAKKGILVEVSFNPTKPEEKIRYVNQNLMIQIPLNSTKAPVSSIPLSALYADEKGYFVYVLNKGVTERREIKVGLIGYDLAEIKAGLTSKDRFVVAIKNYIQPGQVFKNNK